MISRKSIVLLLSAGIVFAAGIVLVSAFFMHQAAGPTGTGSNSAGTAGILPHEESGEIPVFSSKEEIASFLSSHTKPGTSPRQDETPVTVPALSSPQPGAMRTWQFDIDTSTFKPDEYLVTATAVLYPATGTALFDLLDPSQAETGSYPVQAPRGLTGGDSIGVDPVGYHYVGEKITITGTTNLPADAEILVQVYSSSFKPTDKGQSGEFSGATGMTKTTDSPASSSVSDSSPSYSTTNVQVSGVDEADIVKTDGKNIYAISGSYLYILHAYPAESAKIIATERFSGTPVSLYLDGDRAVLISTTQKPRDAWSCGYGKCLGAPVDDTKTLIFIYSVNDPGHPSLEREIEVDGSYSDSRMIGSVLYFIATNPAGTGPGDVTIPAILDHDIGTVIPPVYYFDRKDQAFVYSTIGAVDTGGNDPVRAKTFLIGSAGTVYVSPSHLYVAVPSQGDATVAATTDIYSFTLDGATIRYSAHGSFEGSLLNQFSLDEYGGNLRVAATVEKWGSRLAHWSNTVYVLDDRLHLSGSLDNIAPDERIYSARFTGDTLYLVTFRKTDPFFVIGLHDPKNPVILGKLDLPGYSGYLQPYDDTHIIGVGKEEGGGVKLALFDVRNVSSPRLVDSLEIGIGGSDSEILRDHKAFLLDREKDLLVLPVHVVERQIISARKPTPYTPNPEWGGAMVYGVDPDTGFTLKGVVKHYGPEGGIKTPVKRALYIGNTLYTMSSASVVMSDLSNQSFRLGEITFS